MSLTLYGLGTVRTVAPLDPAASPAGVAEPQRVVDLFEAPRRASPEKRIQELSKLSPRELDRLFFAAPEPTALPSGRAVGEHVVPENSRADVPWLVETAALHFWKAKDFDPEKGFIEDRVTLFPDTRAALYMGNLDAAIDRARGHDPRRPPYSDGRKAVITDYTATSNFPVDVKWIDELREIEPNVWLGRSFYDGELWAHVLLRFEPEEC